MKWIVIVSIALIIVWISITESYDAGYKQGRTDERLDTLKERKDNKMLYSSDCISRKKAIKYTAFELEKIMYDEQAQYIVPLVEDALNKVPSIYSTQEEGDAE